MGSFGVGTTTVSVFVAWFFLSCIPDVENSLAELSCNQTEYESMLSAIPNDTGSATSKCRDHIEMTIKESSDSLGVNYTANSKHFTILCSADGCLAHAARIAKFCLQKLEPILTLGCSNNSDSMCWSIPSSENGTTAQEKCSSNTAGNCSSECKTELDRVLTVTECCFSNVFDSELFGTTFSSTGIANASLLSACQLQKPSACPVPSDITNAQRVPTATEAAESSQQFLSLTSLWTLFSIISLVHTIF